MTGPEHYLEAERLLSGAQNVMDVAPVDGLTRTECAELAQVHATLALAAVTAHHMVATTVDDREEWGKAIGSEGEPDVARSVW
ncbi:hypothetical protein ACIG0A_33525 [Streptomyces californicus]|uniref:hypothetical protein n=1 Tax=Streptomyces californicus TaxID=67351 RepID=UPI0037D66DD5